MIWISDYDVVEDFDFEKLTGSNEGSLGRGGHV